MKLFKAKNKKRRFTILNNIEIVSVENYWTDNVVGKQWLVYTFSIVTSTMLKLSIDVEGLIPFIADNGANYRESGGIILFHGGMKLSKVSFNPSTGENIEVILYEHEELPVTTEYWLLHPLSAIRRVRANRKRKKLPYLGIPGLLTCIEAIHKYVNDDGVYINHSIRKPLELILSALREQDQLIVTEETIS